jgi:acyl-CoA thioester hydrolase
MTILDNQQSETTVRVRYKETDQMGVVYHGNYLTYFEIGRVEYLRDRGMAYKEMEEVDDSYIVVAETHCRHLRPAYYDDVLRIRTRVSRARRRTLRFAYEIVNDATGQLLTTGETVHVVCNKAGRPKALPEKYWKLFPSSAIAGEETDLNKDSRRRLNDWEPA